MLQSDASILPALASKPSKLHPRLSRHDHVILTPKICSAARIVRVEHYLQGFSLRPKLKELLCKIGQFRDVDAGSTQSEGRVGTGFNLGRVPFNLGFEPRMESRLNLGLNLESNLVVVVVVVVVAVAVRIVGVVVVAVEAVVAVVVVAEDFGDPKNGAAKRIQF